MHLKSNRKNKTNKMTDIFTSNITHNVAPVDPSDNIGSVDKPLYCNQRDAVIYFPCSVEQMTKYISEFKQILFDSFWKYTCEVNRAGVLNLFYGYRRQPSVAKYTLTHIQPHILQTMLPPKHHDWWEIKKLPLDEQRKLAAAIKPADFDAYYNSLAWKFRERVSDFVPNIPEDIRAALVYSRSALDCASIYKRVIAVQFLLFLASKRQILLPYEAGTYVLTTNWRTVQTPYIDYGSYPGLSDAVRDPVRKFYIEVVESCFHYDRPTRVEKNRHNYPLMVRRFVLSFLLSSTLDSRQSMNANWIQYINTTYLRLQHITRNHSDWGLKHVVRTLRQVYDALHPETPTAKISVPEQLRQYFLDTEPAILQHQDYDKIFGFITRSSYSNFKEVACNFRHLTSYLWPKFKHRSFAEVTREDCRGFRDHIAQSGLAAASLNDILAVAHKFFIYLEKQTGHPRHNPINIDGDRFNAGPKQPFTHRETIPLFVLQRMKEVLIRNDYAFAKAMSSQMVVTQDNQTGKLVRAWNPVCTIALYTLLTMDLRTMGVRTLDSGELDSMVVDTVGKVYARNPNKAAISKRKEGVFRVHNNLKYPILAMHVQAHKGHGAYDIPFIPDDLVAQLNYMIEWQKRYGGSPRLVNFADDPLNARSNEGLHGALGIKIVPLFRDMQRKSGEQFYPVTNARLQALFVALCRQIDAELPNVNLCNDVGGRKKVMIDKHTLRVSINTHLQYVGGLPLQDAQVLLNHATPVMTMYNTKPSQDGLHERLRNAYARINNSTADILRDYHADSSKFVHGETAQGVANHTKSRSSLWRVDLSGICPGASCLTGGPAVSDMAHAVPEQRCALCRHRITGPQFLLGLTLEANNLMYRLKSSAKRMRSLNEQVIIAEDSKDSRALAILRNELETLNNASTLDWQEWQAIIVLISECNRKLENPDHVGNALVPFSPTVQTEMEDTSEFDLMQSITQGMELFTIASKVQNREAMLSKHDLINNLFMRSSQGQSAGLLSLPESVRLKAGNMFGEFILRHIPHSKVDALLAGNEKLEEYPALQRILQTGISEVKKALQQQKIQNNDYRD